MGQRVWGKLIKAPIPFEPTKMNDDEKWMVYILENQEKLSLDEMKDIIKRNVFYFDHMKFESKKDIINLLTPHTF